MRIKPFSYAPSSDEINAFGTDRLSSDAILRPSAVIDYGAECRRAGDRSSDFFDIVSLDDAELRVFIGDVSAPSPIGAGIITSGVRTYLSNLSAKPSGELPAVVHGLNRALSGISPEDFYITLFYAHIDPARRQLRYISAGHEPVLLYRRSSNQLRRLENTGTVLGLSARSVFRQKTAFAEPGDTLIAFTDGITETAGTAGESFREEDIVRLLHQYPRARAAELSARIMDASEEFRRGCPTSDDRTVLVVRWLDSAARFRDVECVADLAMAAA
ncbi:MAG TPA: PP2C family protein-serine/threonine phosphatase [Bryobacteraceae bacterium]